MNFIKHPWHDAILKEIKIDRSNPGYEDVIVLTVQWQNGLETVFCFQDVYYAKLDLNFGVIADESISSVNYLPVDNENVIAFVKKWEALVPEIKDLFFVEIKTSSTGSDIKIFSKKIIIL